MAWHIIQAAKATKGTWRPRTFSPALRPTLAAPRALKATNSYKILLRLVPSLTVVDKAAGANMRLSFRPLLVRVGIAADLVLHGRERQTPVAVVNGQANRHAPKPMLDIRGQLSVQLTQTVTRQHADGAAGRPVIVG